MSRKQVVDLVFWVLVMVDAIGLARLLALTLTDQPRGVSDGGYEMALAFSLVLPALTLVSAIILYCLSRSAVLRTLAMLIVLAPVVFTVSSWTDTMVHTQIMS